MNKKLIITLVLTIIYALITLVAVLHHEIWADEAQVWQLCKYLTPSELINHLHIEGHPSFFYFIIMPFAKLFSDIIFMQIICWLFMVISVGIFIYYSPFRWYTKLSVILSSGFFYFLPVMARSYSIIPFLIFLIAIFTPPHSLKKPFLYCLLLVLIANTHTIMFAFSFVLLCDFIYRYVIKSNDKNKVKCLIYAILTSIGLLLVVLQLHDTTAINNYIKFNFTDSLVNLKRILILFFSCSVDKYGVSIESVLKFCMIPYIIINFVSFLLCYISLFKRDKKMFYLAFLSVGFQLFIYIFVYSENVYVTRIFCAYLILLFCFWTVLSANVINISKGISSDKAINIILTILFLSTSYNGFNFYIKDYKYDYSGAKKAAEFIVKNLDKSSVIIVNNEPYHEAIIYYLDNTPFHVYSIMRGKNIKYVIWDKISNIQIEGKPFIDYLKSNKIPYDVYVIKCHLEENKENKRLASFKENFTLVYKSGYTIEKNENFSIYKYLP